MCRFLLLKSRKFPLFSLRNKAENRTNSQAPSERELAPKATEGECETFVLLPLSVFRRLSVSRSPSVTLTRDTFLPEEGSG
ncbi:MAG: hypothetical protein EGP89_00170 [Ruminococcaceae bacterium]|nr:hypothetical protein [Oscillospiraceae bacterium]